MACILQVDAAFLRQCDFKKYFDELIDKGYVI